MTEWLNLLNREARRQFRAVEGNLRPIRARLREGYTLEQAEVVVKHKVREWRGTAQAEYLRPVTLFGSKFDAYLQAAQVGGTGPVPRNRTNAAWDGQPVGEVVL